MVMIKAKSLGMREEDYPSTCIKRVMGFHKTYSQGLGNSLYTKGLMEGEFHVPVEQAVDDRI